jgi:hypothetical protein
MTVLNGTDWLSQIIYSTIKRKNIQTMRYCNAWTWNIGQQSTERTEKLLRYCNAWTWNIGQETIEHRQVSR